VLSGGAGPTFLGGAGNDVLDGGGGSDILDGGSGDDSLYGGADADEYRFGIGSGHDTLVDFDASGPATDTIRMGSGVAPGDVSVSQEGAYLVLSLATSSDTLAVRTFGREGYGIERVVFEDGSEWNAEQLYAMASLAAAGERSDVGFVPAGTTRCRGSAVTTSLTPARAPLLSGNAGDDVLPAAGDNTLDSGPGFDHLTGGEGAVPSL
jgi:Ca2+-binding RTX toxin-like protein